MATPAEGVPARALRVSAAVVPAAGVSAGPPASAVGNPIDAASDCQQVVFLGARGSGAKLTVASGLGPEVYEAWLQYKGKVALPQMGFWANPYPAAPADELATSQTAREVFTKSIDEGVATELTFLTTRATRCKGEHYVLAGYSQGAMLHHRVLDAIAAKPWRSRIDGALLVGDGDRQGSNTPSLSAYGTADRASSSFGISWFPAVQVAMHYRYPPGVSTTGVFDVCMKADLICDFSPLDGGMDVHNNAYSRWGQGANAGSGLVYLRSAATNIAKVTTRWATQPRVVTDAVTSGTVNAPYTLTLDAAGGVAPYSWVVSANRLPTGLNLNASGIISGIPTIAESRRFTARVTDSKGSTGDKVLTLTVLPISDGTFRQISTAGSYTCAVTTAGAAKCWGYNGVGYLGDGTTADRTRPGPVTGLESGVATISRSCAVTDTGAATCWGNNREGQVGDGTGIDRLTPVPVSGLSSGVVSITAGGEHTCVLTTASGAKCWGRNSFGEIGGGPGSHTSPVEVSGLSSGVAALSAGGAHTCAVTTAGAAQCWGLGRYGQLGNGDVGTFTTPVPVVGLASGVAAIAAASDHTCAVTVTGALKCWGENTRGQVGDGTTTNQLTPVDVPGLSSGVRAVSGGYDYTCALTTSGAVKCWGANDYGQLGDGTGVDRPTPVPVSGLQSGVVGLSVGYSSACALLSSGSAKCWGKNSFGQLGDGTTINRLSPVSVQG